MTYSWGKPEEVVAQKFLKNQLPGMFKKELIVKEDEVCLVEKGQKIINEFGQGKHTVSSIFGDNLNDLILVDVSSKNIVSAIPDLLTKDDMKVTCNMEMGFLIYSPEKFSRAFMKDRNVVTTEDILNDLRSELLTRVMQPLVASKNITDLYGNKEVIDEIASSFEFEMKNKLEQWGVELESLNVMWEFPEDYEDQIKEKAEIKKGSEIRDVEHEEELREEERSKETEHMKGETELEKTKSELKSERTKREFELEISKKEDSEDVDEALEGLELKNIMDKQKKVNKEDD